MATRKKPRRVDPRAVRIGEHLRLLRERRRLSQEDVAQHLGLTTGAYQHYEAGRSLPGMADVPRLGAALGVAPCELFPADLIPEGVRPAKAEGAPYEPTEADLIARDLVAGWDQLPESERFFLRGIARLHRDYLDLFGDGDEG